MYFIFYWAEFWHSLLPARVAFFFFQVNDLFVTMETNCRGTKKETDIFTMDNLNLEFLWP